jgi:high-affinity nickel-transport protein
VNVVAVLGLGFFLGMRHATDADHVVAVSAIVSREGTLRAATPIGILWGIGHTITIFLVGGAIILFGVVIPPHLGLAMELCVALMLVLLGAWNIRGVVRSAAQVPDERGLLLHADRHPHPHPHPHPESSTHAQSMRPLFVGIVHGLAGSAAIALLVLGTIRNTFWALGYLLVFGVGTIAGMLIITTAIALPIAATAKRFERLHGMLGIVTGVASIAFGGLLIYEIGFVHGLFTAHPQWTPQ